MGLPNLFGALFLLRGEIFEYRGTTNNSSNMFLSSTHNTFNVNHNILFVTKGAHK